MLRRLRHRVFGHGQDGHHFAGHYKNVIYLFCRCEQILSFSLTNFYGNFFESIPDGEPPSAEVRARAADELNRHGTT